MARTLTTPLPRPRRSSADTYSTRAEAITAAREALWGSATVRGCGFLPIPRGVLGIYVTADVNGRLVLIDFDNYGRASVEQVD